MSALAQKIPAPNVPVKTGKIDWIGNIPFLLIHAAVLGAFFVRFHWWYIPLAIGSYYLRMFFVTAGYHRYFSHRTFKMNRASQFFFAWMASTTAQKGVLWWAANHRHHHRYSDQPEDIHSPIQRGFWWSHVGWIMSKEHLKTQWHQIQDLAKFPELRLLNRYHLVPAIAYAVAFFLLGGWGALIWGFMISTVLLWHGTFTINSLSHVFGSRRYQTADTSRNNALLAVVTMGEGWHNNHHSCMSSTRQGFFWWEWDPTFYILKAMSWIRITRDLRDPPLELLEAKRIKRREPFPRAQTSIPLDESSDCSVSRA